MKPFIPWIVLFIYLIAEAVSHWLCLPMGRHKSRKRKIKKFRTQPKSQHPSL